MVTNRESTTTEASLHALAILSFPVCIYFWLIFTDFPLHRHFTGLPANKNWESSQRRGTWRKLTTALIRINRNGHSSLKLSNLPYMSTSPGFANRNYHMWLQFNFLTRLRNLRWWKLESGLLYFFFFFLRHIQLSSCLFWCYDGIWSWGTIYKSPRKWDVFHSFVTNWSSNLWSYSNCFIPLWHLLITFFTRKCLKVTCEYALLRILQFLKNSPASQKLKDSK